MSQQIIYNNQNQPLYNIMYGTQTMYRNQNTFPNSSSFNSFPQSWMPEPCLTNPELLAKDKYFKNDKLNCCMSPLSNVYKTVNKNVCYNKNSRMDPQWFYSTNYDNQINQIYEFPSCAQLSVENNSASYISNINQCCDTKIGKPVKYCSLQKCSDNDSKLLLYLNNKYDNSNAYVNQQKTVEYQNCSQLTDISSSYNPTILENYDYSSNRNYCAEQNFNVPKIENKVESRSSVGESDIIVEDSEDEVTDESEDVQVCVVCNLTTRDNLYLITNETPVAMYSQSLIFDKLNSLVGLKNTSSYLCSNCLELINTIDNLELQLNNVKRDLLFKYKSANNSLKNCAEKTEFTCKKTRPKKIKFRVNDVCGVHSFKCSICEKIFSLKKFYKYHMSRHKIRTQFLCEYCGCLFTKKSNLLVHLRKHYQHYSYTKSNNLMCHICGKLLKNIKNHLCSGALPFHCNICNNKFPSAIKLKQHVRLKHENKFKNSCNICGKGFLKKSDFNSHLLSHSNERKFKCNICNKRYKTQSNLNHHSKIHASKLPFNCKFCEKGFIRKENLDAHLNVHNGVKPFKCPICGKSFVAQKNLDAHSQLHRDVITKKPCPVCGKQLRRLGDHLKMHANNRDLSCGFCPLKFITQAALAKHKKRKHCN